MRYHIIAFFGGFLLDLILGDPYWLPHPIRAIGTLIAALERCLLNNKDLDSKKKRRRGVLLVVLVCAASVLVTAALLFLAYALHPAAGCVLELVMTYQLLAMKSLRTESMKVYGCLEHGTIEEARHAVSMIVGRDTEQLDKKQVAKAAVETVAENASDGVIAPMLFAAIGGPVLGFFYKAVNTMDSMVGYKNERYMDFGRCAARLDDAVNFLPARISAMLMIAACTFLGPDYSARSAAHIYRRDRRNHASPNSAQTESVCAGALGIRLAGDASYFGTVVHKPYIGDAGREIEPEDIRRANRLMYGTGFLCELITLAVLALFL